jgi:hypothetical protein
MSFFAKVPVTEPSSAGGIGDAVLLVSCRLRYAVVSGMVKLQVKLEFKKEP